MLNSVDYNIEIYINLIFAAFFGGQFDFFASGEKFIDNTLSYLSNKSFFLSEYPRVGPCKNEYHKKRLETL